MRSVEDCGTKRNRTYSFGTALPEHAGLRRLDGRQAETGWCRSRSLLDQLPLHFSHHRHFKCARDASQLELLQQAAQPVWPALQQKHIRHLLPIHPHQSFPVVLRVLLGQPS